MADLHEIKCINKSDRYNIHERILSIGGIKSDGTRWKLSLTDAIDGIESNKWTFYVNNSSGHKVKVLVAKTTTGNKYLRTEADTTEKNNLLELPECP
ncbi:uncharacterized protein DUF3892 [Flavobacterium araucananum]|uniref:DUF3892 domain-containing protein n=1 Tax=Flavobacterium araucananum TaxID=946678 RepID=A0A227NXP1_9FLAO|nr:DUF3892 domain-containing protein [Flavobacterium araucananum]OXG01575.1 hypothetical protein B0A64_19115 [Flavobacterium araucananum]PWJ98964.1 uncharacterized protein DUF3892 [Flavobacterium araucananum]